MKLSHVLVAVSAISVASLANANDFTGFGISADLQFKSSGGKISYSDVEVWEGYTYNETESSSIGGEQDVIGGLNLSYGFMIAPQFVMQVGATADLAKTDIYKASSSDGDESESVSLKEKSHYSIYVAPGYLVTPKTMVYAKLAYHRMKVKSSYNESWYEGSFSESGTQSFKGFGFGAGVQTMLTANVFAYAEIQRVQYGKETLYSNSGQDWSESSSAKPRSTIGAVGIGYRF